jgi:hypothetical protein
MIVCPFCSAVFASPEDWCPHFLGTQSDLTLDDYKDFISGRYQAETVADEEGIPYYFMVRETEGEGE